MEMLGLFASPGRRRAKPLPGTGGGGAERRAGGRHHGPGAWREPESGGGACRLRRGRLVLPGVSLRTL